MFSELLSDFSSSISSYEEKCNDSKNRKIAASLADVSAAMAQIGQSVKDALCKVRENDDKRKILDSQLQDILSRIDGNKPQNHYEEQDYKPRNTSDNSDDSQEKSFPHNQHQQPINYKHDFPNPRNKVHKEVHMSEKDKQVEQQFNQQFVAVGLMEEMLRQVDKFIEDISRSEEILENLSSVEIEYEKSTPIEESDLMMWNNEKCKFDEYQRKASFILMSIKMTKLKLKEIIAEAQQISSQIASDEETTGYFLKRMYGFSMRARRFLESFNKAKRIIKSIEGSILSNEPNHLLFSKVEEKVNILEYRASQLEQQCKTELKNRSDFYNQAESAYNNRSSAIKKKNELMLNLAEVLAKITNKDKNLFLRRIQIENGNTILNFPTDTTPRSIIKNAISVFLTKIKNIAENCRGIQKKFIELGPDDMNETLAFPQHVILGDMQAYLFNNKFNLPFCLKFPFARPIIFEDDVDIASSIVRMLYVLPAGKTYVSVIDHENAGENGSILNALCGECALMHLATSIDDVSPILKELDEYMGRMSREVFSYGERDWDSYNKNHSGEPLPLRIIAIYSFSNLSILQKELVLKILKNGGKFGIVCMLSSRALENLEPRDGECFKSIDTERILGNSCSIDKYSKLELSMTRDEAVTIAHLGKLAEIYANKYLESTKKPKRDINFISLFEDVGLWESSSANGISATIGWSASTGEPVKFEFGVGKCDAAYHALVGGTTGSGKSIFLHTLIQSLTAKYSPEELELYLLDYKKGDEFKKYANDDGIAWLPHIKTISMHKDPRYALELFDFLDQEFKRRSKMFGNYGDIIAYRRNGGKVPRILVVVDEFQVMFEEYCGLNLSDEVAKHLSTILKQGRAYGIHIILATQSLASLHFSGMTGMLGQIGLRIALKGTASDCILADGNRAAENIIPKRQCIVNPVFGLRDTADTINNIVTDVPFSDPVQVADCKKIRKLIELKTRQMKLHNVCKVFNGVALPLKPELSVCREVLKPIHWNTHFSLLVGAKTDFASTPLAIEFLHEQREHLLIAGEDGSLSNDFEVKITGEDVWTGIRRGIVASLEEIKSCEVFYYNPSERTVPKDIPDYFLKLAGMAKENEVLRALQELTKSMCERKVVIVENFQDAKFLHPGDAPRPSYSSRSSAPVPEPETARSLFASVFNGTDEPKFHVIIMTKNFSFMNRDVLSRSGAEVNLVKSCGKRIAFNLSDDDLGTMIQHLKSQDRRGPRRVWYEEIRTGLVLDFLPYEW